MLTASPETAFVLRTVEFVMAGLVLLVLGWLIWREAGRRREWIQLTAPFLLLLVSFGLGAWSSYLLFSTSVVAPFQSLASELLETAGLAGVMRVLLREAWGRLAWIGFAGPAAEVLGILYLGAPTSYPPSLAHSLA